MKRRAWRITIGAATLGVALAAVLAVAHRDSLRDHVEAWRFQLTRTTETIEPPVAGRTVIGSTPLSPSARADAYRAGGTVLHGEAALARFWEGFLFVAANELRRPVIYDPRDRPPSIWGSTFPRTVCNIRGFLERSGFRLVEQRFPRKACVLIREGHNAPAP